MSSKNNLKINANTLLHFRKTMGSLLRAFSLGTPENMAQLNRVRTCLEAKRVVLKLRFSPVADRFAKVGGMELINTYAITGRSREITCIRIYFLITGVSRHTFDQVQAFVDITNKGAGLSLPGGIITTDGDKQGEYEKNGFREEIKNFPEDVKKPALFLYRALLQTFTSVIKIGHGRQIWQRMHDELFVLQRPDRAIVNPTLLPNLPAFFEMVDWVYRSEETPWGSLGEKYGLVREKVEARRDLRVADILEMMGIKHEACDLFISTTDGAMLVSFGARIPLLNDRGEIEDLLTLTVEEGYGAGTCTFTKSKCFAVSTNRASKPVISQLQLRRVCQRDENRRRAMAALQAFATYVAHDKAAQSRCRQALMFVGTC